MSQMPEGDFYETPEHGWTCFHCGETFKLPGLARAHFGFDPASDPACRIKIGAERGLVFALRDAEEDAAKAWSAIHDETTDAAKACHSMAARHIAQLRQVEEAGYECGIEDMRDERDEALASLSALRAEGKMLEEQLEDVRRQHNEACSELAAERDALRAELEEAREALRSFEPWA